MRFRYVVFRVDSESSPSERGLIDELSGILGDCNLKLVYYDRRRGILRCTHKSKERTVAALNALHEVDRMTVTIRTVGTSGTIRKARAKFLS